MNTSNLHQFFLVTPIHFEELALQELKLKAPEIKATTVKGGVEFSTDLTTGVELNYHLKIPTKILLRVGQFKARDFPKLYNSLLKLPWRNYLRAEIPEVHVSCQKSRLMNTDRIADTAKDSFARFNQMFPAKARNKDQPSITQSVYLRFVDDTCTASIDTSGERLHKRSYREFTGHAPIRENLAAGLVFYTWEQLSNKPSEQAPTMLVDPMCGTGTFLAEAKTFLTPNFSRGFHFEDFPSYRASLKPRTYEHQLPWKNFLGFDIDPEVIKANQKQLAEFGIKLAVKDVFSNEGIANSVLILNPPYGKRISIKGNPQNYFNNLIEHLIKVYAPMGLGILVPQEYHTPKCRGYKKQILLFKNGGIDIAFTLYIQT